METYATEGNALILGFSPQAGDYLEVSASADAMTQWPVDGSELIFEANLEVAQVLNGAVVALLLLLIGQYQLPRTHDPLARRELLENIAVWEREYNRQMQMANIAVTLKQGRQQTMPPIGLRKQSTGYR